MKAFAIFCAVVVAGFAWLEAAGVDLLPDASHASLPSSVRGAPGAYRTYRHWGGGGFRGGK